MHQSLGLFIAPFLMVSGAAVSVAEASTWQAKPATEFALPTPARVGAFQHPVIFASSVVQSQQVGRASAVVRQKLVVRWGLHVFEMGEAVYSCATAKDCEFDDFVRLATYELCEVKNEKLACTGRLSGDDGAVENNSPHIHDTFDVDPERGAGEFDDLSSSPRSSPNSSEESTR